MSSYPTFEEVGKLTEVPLPTVARLYWMALSMLSTRVPMYNGHTPQDVHAAVVEQAQRIYKENRDETQPAVHAE